MCRDEQRTARKGEALVGRVGRGEVRGRALHRCELFGRSRGERSGERTGQLAVPQEECRDVVWAMTDGMLWHRLVNECGWSNERFAEWLGRIWVDRLVQPKPRRRRSASI